VPLNFQRELEPARLTAQSNKLAKDRANIAVGLAVVHADQLVPRVIHVPGSVARKVLRNCISHPVAAGGGINENSSTSAKETSGTACERGPREQ